MTGIYQIKKYLNSSLFAILAFALSISSSLALAFVPTASAIGEGQIAGGNIYRVRNVSQGGQFADPVSANKCEILQYRVRLHNPGPGVVNNVRVAVSLPAGVGSVNTSTVNITAENSQPASVSDTATVNLTTPQKISYVPGTSQLLDASGNVLQNITDVVNGSSVNIGNVEVSIEQIRYVQFQAKVDCPQTPPPCVDNPNTPGDDCNPRPPCTDNPNTPGDDCNPKPPCTDNPNTPADECNQPKPADEAPEE